MRVGEYGKFKRMLAYGWCAHIHGEDELIPKTKIVSCSPGSTFFIHNNEQILLNKEIELY